MPVAQKHNVLTPDEYLQEELEAPVKRELIDGQIYAMAGASANHERIAGNIYSELRNHLKATPCEPFSSDMKVRVRDNFYYPEDEQQLSEVVKELYKKNLPTEIVGTGTKSFIGNKIQ